MAYAWRDWTFEAPAGLSDQSMILFVDESADASFSVSIARDALQGRALAHYVDEAVRELTNRLKSFRVQGRSTLQAAGRPALLVEQTARGDDGAPVCQAQAFIEDGDGVTIVTVTGGEADAARARTALQTVLDSMTKAPRLSTTEPGTP